MPSVRYNYPITLAYSVLCEQHADVWVYSCANKAKPEDTGNQVQGPMQASSVHLKVEGFGQGG